MLREFGGRDGRGHDRSRRLGAGNPERHGWLAGVQEMRAGLDREERGAKRVAPEQPRALALAWLSQRRTPSERLSRRSPAAAFSPTLSLSRVLLASCFSSLSALHMSCGRTRLSVLLQTVDHSAIEACSAELLDLVGPRGLSLSPSCRPSPPALRRRICPSCGPAVRVQRCLVRSVLHTL